MTEAKLRHLNGIYVARRSLSLEASRRKSAVGRCFGKNVRYLIWLSCYLSLVVPLPMAWRGSLWSTVSHLTDDACKVDPRVIFKAKDADWLTVDFHGVAFHSACHSLQLTQANA